VRIVGMAMGTVWALILGANVVLGPGFSATGFPGSGGWPSPNWIFAAIGLGGSLGLIVLAPRLQNHPRLVLDIGLGFEVFTAALIALISFWVPEPHAARISWNCALILLFPAIAPSPKRKMLLVSFAAASMDAVAFFVARSRGLALDWPLSYILWMLAPGYLSALLALVPATLIRYLGQQVTAAREMGSYRLGNLLGRGGMGSVYQASHRMIARPAAIKVIRGDLLSSDPELAATITERFYREAEAVAALRSPHTVQLYDFGQAEDGGLYYVMELLDGIDLQKFVESFGPLETPRAIHILRQVCESLQEAHETGLIHRDVKPSNIVLCRLGLRVDFVKVLDFGLVRRENPKDKRNRRLESTATLGTPSFMAPEAITTSAPADRRADVYALGCVAYWLVTGHQVFEGESAMQVMFRHAHEEPKPPSQRISSPLPTDFERVVLNALVKDPEARTQSAQDFANELSRCADATRWTESEARRWWNDHGRSLGIAGLRH
jgi:serine/threonine-protein kinase